MKKLKTIFNYFGSPNWYKGIDKPNLYQRLYKWRISLGTAIKLSKLIHGKK